MTNKEKIKNLFRLLSTEEQSELLSEFTTSINKQIGQQSGTSKVTNCPYCKSTLLVRNGYIDNVQRYKCKFCHKTFIATIGSSEYNLKKRNKFEEYKSLILEQYYPIKKIAEKVGISVQTAFDWRHKILSGLKKQDTEFSGITELDDIWFLYSQKGRKGLKYSRKRGGSKRQGDNNYQVKMLVTADRKANVDMSIVRIGRLKKSDIERSVGDKFSPDSTLVSDKHRSISSFAKVKNLCHVSFKAAKHSAGGIYHVQNVNNIASRMKSIVNHHLRGVSSKYLQSYANWFAFMERNKNDRELKQKLDQELNQNEENWYIFTNIEHWYKQFIKNRSVRTYRCPTKRVWKRTYMKLGAFNGIMYI